MNVRVVASLLLAAMLALVGCSESESGAAVSGDGGGGSEAPAEPGEPTVDSPADQPAEDVPTVADPIEDIADFRDDPCSMLTDEQASRIGYTNTESLDTPNGDACEWREDDGTVSASLFPEESLGLDGPYSQRDSYTYFEPTEVDGYPAVHAGLGDGETGDCGLAVGITDDQLLDFQVQLHMSSPDRERPCEVAQEAASAVLETLKAAQ